MEDTSRGRLIDERRYEILDMDRGRKAQTVDRFGRNVSGTNLIGIQTQHSQLWEVGHVNHTAETAQRELWKKKDEK